MSSVLQASLLLGATVPTAALAQIPYASAQAGQLEVSDRFAFNATEVCLVTPLLTADPATNPASATTVFLYVKLAGGNYTINAKNSAGAVKAAALA